MVTGHAQHGSLPAASERRRSHLTCLGCSTIFKYTLCVAGAKPVGDVVLEPVRARRPRRLCGAVLAACKTAAVWVVIAWALEAAAYVIRPDSRSADEIDVDNPGEVCIAQACHHNTMGLLHGRKMGIGNAARCPSCKRKGPKRLNGCPSLCCRVVWQEPQHFHQAP